MRWLLLFLMSPCLWLSPMSDASQDTIRIATTTSVKSSGLLDIIKPAFEQESRTQLELIVVGTGRALHLGRAGEVDLLLVHAPDAEKTFIEEGFGERRIPLLHNHFSIIGPQDDPAQIKGMQDVVAIFRQIEQTQSLFVSRADDSGTNKKELMIWQAAGIQPYGTWYYEAGLGMGATLALAEQQQAYTLVDIATWLKQRNALSLELILAKGDLLENTYSVILLDKEKFPQLNHQSAEQFVSWLRSKKARKLIEGMAIDNERLFYFTD